MSLAKQCKFFGHIISIEKALAIRDAAQPKEKKILAFECVKCGKAVRPHNSGDRCAAHFVHLSHNPECVFIDPPRDC